jgi:hypothetical protein
MKTYSELFSSVPLFAKLLKQKSRAVFPSRRWVEIRTANRTGKPAVQFIPIAACAVNACFACVRNTNNSVCYQDHMDEIHTPMLF